MPSRHEAQQMMQGEPRTPKALKLKTIAKFCTLMVDVLRWCARHAHSGTVLGQRSTRQQPNSATLIMRELAQLAALCSEPRTRATLDMPVAIDMKERK
jgi:hypothetical protein